MDLTNLQNILAKENLKLGEIYALKDRELALAMNVKLSEEVGEVSDQLLGNFELQREDKLHKYSKELLGEELLDVIFVATRIGAISNIDLNALAEKRLEKLTQVK